MRKRVSAVIWFTVMFIGVAGCRTAQTAFQVDSDSRTPSFGLMLAPKRQQPDVIGIRQTSVDVVESTLADRRTRNSTVIRPRRPKLLGQMASPQRIPLPRSDLDRPAAEQPSAD